jgi:hypothetical protein
MKEQTELYLQALAEAKAIVAEKKSKKTSKSAIIEPSVSDQEELNLLPDERSE